MQTLLIAIGNTLRRDDGVGHRVLELLGPMPEVRVRRLQQLTPETAAELPGAGRVIFVDADAEGGEVRIEPLPASGGRVTPIGHAIRPPEIVVLSEKLYGFRGAAFLCRIPARDFSEGETLSPETEGNAATAARLLRAFLRQSNSASL